MEEIRDIIDKNTDDKIKWLFANLFSLSVSKVPINLSLLEQNIKCWHLSIACRAVMMTSLR